MGANHKNEINFLCEIAKPNYGIITNIGKAHLEGFKNFDGVKSTCLLYTSPSPRDRQKSRMPSSA